MRSRWVGILLAAVLVACGGGGRLSVSEYAAATESLVATLTSRFDALQAEWSSKVPTLEGAQSYFDSRIEIRQDLLGGLRALEPPVELADLHETAIDLFTKVNTAEEALAARVAGFRNAAEFEQMWETPEGQAAQAALEDVLALCGATQAEFDATTDREAFGDLPWVPPEMKEVIHVAYHCSP